MTILTFISRKLNYRYFSRRSRVQRIVLPTHPVIMRQVIRMFSRRR